jgi:hypothetical protein
MLFTIWSLPWRTAAKSSSQARSRFDELGFPRPVDLCDGLRDPRGRDIAAVGILLSQGRDYLDYLIVQLDHLFV